MRFGLRLNLGCRVWHFIAARSGGDPRDMCCVPLDGAEMDGGGWPGSAHSWHS
jgi:hypothetical protein